MRIKIITLIGTLILLSFANITVATGSDHIANPIYPKEVIKKYRIGYIQGGDYTDYRKTLLATIQGLMTLGWIENAGLDHLDGKDGGSIWEWLSKGARSNHLVFISDAFYDAQWDTALRVSEKERLFSRLKERKDIDLIIAMGTWAGLDLSQLDITTNVLVMTASDPYASGIVKGVQHSGQKNLHAHVDPSLCKRQLRLFHNATGFQKLGVIYEDSVAGRSYAGLSPVKELSEELGFEPVTCTAVSDIPDQKVSEREYLTCIEKLAFNIDALFVTIHGGVNDNSLPQIVKTCEHRRIPTFSQSGAHEVRNGLLMSLSRNDFKKVGMFEAATMAKVINGANPGDLTQVFEEKLKISLNLKTAKNIGFIPQADIIAATDIIFE